MSLELRPADLASIRRMRHLLLRPHQRPEELVYPGDDAPDALHLGAFEDGRLVGIASITRQPPAGSQEESAWRIRGMATLPEVRGRGIGGALLEACLAHARAQGGSLAWCTGRVPAVAFYRRHGFVSVRGPFELPDTGPHHELHLRLG